MSTRARSLAKGVTWRIVGTCVTFSLVYIFTGNIAITTTVTVLDVIVTIFFYYMHERIWDRIRWGRSPLN